MVLAIRQQVRGDVDHVGHQPAEKWNRELHQPACSRGELSTSLAISLQPSRYISHTDTPHASS